MRVGIFYSPSDKKGGGGYVLTSEIFLNLIKYSEQARHTFVVFSLGKNIILQKSKGKNIEFVNVSRIYKALKIIFSNVYELLVEVLNKFRYPNSIFLDNGSERVFQKIFEKHRIDIYWSIIPGSITTKTPFITTVWDLEHRKHAFFPEISADKQWKKREKMYRNILGQAVSIIVGTQEGKREIEKFYQIPSEHIRVLPLPIPSFAFAPSKNNDDYVLSKYGLKPGYLFYPAQFWPHKNHVCLLYALKFLYDNNNLPLKLVFVGADKGNLKYVRNVVSNLGLSEHVHILGFISTEELIALYRNASALTFASYFGPDNLPPLEAFALGCPVIAAKVAGAEEQLGNAALFFDPANSEQLAEQILSLYKNSDLRAELIQRGFERASHFTVKEYLEEIFSILDEFEPIRRCWSSEEHYHGT